MTKQRNSEQEFDEFMSGHSELSRLYQQTRADGPSEITEQRILAAARKAVDKNGQTASTTNKRWYVPIAIAASIAMLSIFLVLQFQTDDSDVMKTAEQEDGRDIVSNLKPDPASQLADIVQLIKAGKTDVAREQFTAFKQLFPDYPIDFQQHPELAQFKDER